MPDSASLMSVSGLKKSYGGETVLRDISFELRQGEVLSIIGSSGSGKSTLLRCLNLLEMPDEGSVSLKGEIYRTEELSKHSRAQQQHIDNLRMHVAMVFQGFNLWSHLSVLDNVMEGPVHVQKKDRSEVRTLAISLLEKVGLGDKLDAYPDDLSGGQQQRVAIARALAMEPDILLFDEPTSALDPELVVGVLDLLRALADEGRTMVVVTHEMGFAKKVSDHTLFLHDGLVECLGNTNTLFDDPPSERLKQFLKNKLK